MNELNELTWITDYESATEKARADMKPLMIYIWSPTCVGCYKMKKDTFPNNQIIEILSSNFILAKINSKEAPSNFNEIIAPYKYNWSPTIIFKSQYGFEIRRMQGFLDCQNFNAELLTSLTMNNLYLQNYVNVVEYYDEVLNNFPKTAVVPEVLYWKGVAIYLKEKNLQLLIPVWNDLREKYPESTWSIKANLINEVEDILSNKIKLS